MAIPPPSPDAAADGSDGEARSLLPADALPERYRVERQAGSAPGGTRLVATDTETGERVFVKRALDPEAIRREAEIVATLDHPGIIRLRDWRAEAEAAYLVLDFVDGPDLEAFLRRQGGCLAATTLVELLLKLADGVAAIHAGNVIHRDLKPANIIVGKGETPVIVDFGAAAAMKEIGIASATSLVTGGYAAPEQYLSDEPEGPWTDIYALGAIAYRALTGTAPPAAPARLNGESMLPAADAPGDYPQALRRAIDRALALQPAARPQSVAQWKKLFDPTRAAVDGDYPPTVRVERAAGGGAMAWAMADDGGGLPPSGRRRSVTIGVVVVLVCLVSAAVAAAAWFGWPLYERYVKTDWVVDAKGGGDAITIADALSRAGDGANIAIRPGLYAETVVIERPVHLTAAVAGEAPEIAPENGACLVATARGGSVSGLRLHAAAGGDPSATPTPCLLIIGGTLSVKGNRVSSASGAAIVVGDGAEPEIRDNVIDRTAGPGIVVTAGARAAIAGNTITDAAGSSLIVRGGADPKITGNTIERSGGAVFAEGATGTFESNRIVASRTSAIEVTTGADPAVVDNTIEGSAEAGIYVYDHGKGRFEGNTIVGSRLSGVVVASGAAPRLVGNVVRDSGEHGILVIDHSGGVLDRNAVSGSHGHGIAIGRDAETELGENRLDGSTKPQLLDARTP